MCPMISFSRADTNMMGGFESDSAQISGKSAWPGLDLNGVKKERASFTSENVLHLCSLIGQSRGTDHA